MMRYTDLHTSKRWTAISVLVFICTIGLIVYYLFGAANRTITSDTADSLLWAQATYEAKALVNPDFDYATILPLGGHLVMVPFVAWFGLGVTAQQWGMLIFFLLWTASMLFCLRSFGWKYYQVFFMGSFMILMTLLSTMLRAMFYQHILYYSQGLLYLFIGLGLLLRMLKAQERAQRKRAGVLLGILGLWMMLTAVNGEMTLAIFSTPLLCAYLLEWMFQQTEPDSPLKKGKSVWLTAAVLGLCTAAGLAVRSLLCQNLHTEYANGITSLAHQAQWHEHIGNLLRFWMQLMVDQLIQPKILSVTGLLNVMQISVGIILIIVPVVALLRYRSLKEQWERLVVLLHGATTGVILFLYVFTRYGEADWRLIPIVMTSILATVVYIRHALRNATVPWRWISGIVAALFTVNALWSGYFVSQLPPNYRSANAYGLISFLEEQGLTDGYATYWNAIGPTVYAGERIRIRQIKADQERIIPQGYQSNRKWYTGKLDRCFLLVTAKEMDEFASAIPQGFIDLLYYGNDHIFVYDHNIIGS